VSPLHGLKSQCVITEWRPVTLKEGVLLHDEIQFKDGDATQKLLLQLLCATPACQQLQQSEQTQKLLIDSTLKVTAANDDATTTKKQPLHLTSTNPKYTTAYPKPKTIQKAVIQQYFQQGILYSQNCWEPLRAHKTAQTHT
jgi:hypothetical protein